MALIEAAFYLLVLFSIALAVASRWAPALVYVNAIVLFAMLYLQIAAIPLNLNWSRNLYGRLLRRMFAFIVFTALVYATHYYFNGLTRSGEPVESFADALYFSFTTWTTLGYGDITASSALRLATSLEALTGMITIAVVTAMIWLYCQERLWRRSADSPQDAFTLRWEPVFGGFREIETDETARQREERRRKLRLNPCSRCRQTPTIEKFYDIIGRLAPLPNFVVICECGEHIRYSKNAYLAAHRWNRKHRAGD
jgi:Ion channel